MMFEKICRQGQDAHHRCRLHGDIQLSDDPSGQERADRTEQQLAHRHAHHEHRHCQKQAHIAAFCHLPKEQRRQPGREQTHQRYDQCSQHDKDHICPVNTFGDIAHQHRNRQLRQREGLVKADGLILEEVFVFSVDLHPCASFCVIVGVSRQAFGNQRGYAAVILAAGEHRADGVVVPSRLQFYIAPHDAMRPQQIFQSVVQTLHAVRNRPRFDFVIFQNLPDFAAGSGLIALVGGGHFGAQHRIGDAGEGFLEKMIVALFSLLDLLVKPAHIRISLTRPSLLCSVGYTWRMLSFAGVSRS